MNHEEIKKIEDVFRNSKSRDELFDAFQSAVKINLDDLEIYKILIANPVLSPDEIKMFTEKLLKELPQHSPDLLMWTAKIFENQSGNYKNLEDAFNFYCRANYHQPNSHEPLLRLLNLYNYEIEYPLNKKLIETVENSVSGVDKKSKVFYSLSAHYKRCGDRQREIKYLALAEKASARGL